MNDDWKTNPSFFDVLTQEEADKYALHFAHTHDVESTKSFVEQAIKSSQRTGHDSNALAVLRTLLYNDHADMANACFPPNDIEWWCDNNGPRVVRHCPNVFSLWTSSGPSKLSQVVNVLDGLGTKNKEKVLRGEDASPPAQYVLKALMKDTRQWVEMHPDWLGRPGSSLRQAVVNLGVNDATMITMCTQGPWGKAPSLWKGALDFSYSWFVLSSLDKCMHASDRFDSFAHKEYAKIFNAIAHDPLVRPLDAALADILISKGAALHPQFEANRWCRAYPDIEQISREQRAYLAELVDVHIALGSLDALKRMLFREGPGTMPVVEHLELPQMDASEGPIA